MMGDHFLFCEQKMRGIPIMIGDNVAYYKINFQSFKSFLKKWGGDKCKIVSLDCDPQVNTPLVNNIPACLLLNKIMSMRRIENLIFYPEAQEIHFGFKRDKSDMLKIVPI
jgi:hypothetical protein